MHLRVGVVLGFAILGTVVACSDDSPSTATPVDAGSPAADTGTVPGTNDAGTDSGEGGEAIVGAPPGQWTYVPFADSTCANGTPTGIGINPGSSKQLVIYLEGGGACWDETTCYFVESAANLSGWDEAKFHARVAAGTTKSHMDRAAANNPFKDASYVYIPYCTGDVHSGDREQTYGAHVTKHFGRRNVEAFLKRIAPTFKDSDRVILTGSSAGGFGAAVNYWRVKEHFGKTRVDLVDDSGPPFPKEKMTYFSIWMSAWDLAGAIAPGCAECANGNISAVLPYYSKTYPDARFALLSYDHDNVISTFFSISPGEFATALADLTTKSIDPLPNVRAFEVTGPEHTMLGNLETKSGPNELGAWLTTMNQDSASWTTVRPVVAD